MQETYKINQEFTFLDFLNISYYQAFRMKIFKRIFIFLIVVGLLNAILNSVLIPKKIIWYMVVWQFLFLPLFLFMFIIIVGALITIIVMKLKPKLFTKTTLTFTHWGMEKTGEIINYSAPWSKFFKYKETKKYLFLYITDKESHGVQKRMFADNTQLENFKQFISERIHSK